MDLPLHPFLVHFPIAFLFGALVLHAIHLWRPNWICRVVSLWLLGLSTIFSIFSSVSGEWELIKAGEKAYPSEVIELINLHETMGNIITWGSIIFFISWIYLFFNYMDDKRIDKLMFAFLFLFVGLVFFTAYLGGTLVWIHGVGTPNLI